MLASLPAIVLAQTVAGAVLARPVECGAADGGRPANVWERAKSPELVRYCDLLASGAAKLAGASMTQEVLAIADQADHAIAGRAAPSVLRGRALERLGRYPEALSALQAARAIDERSVDEPSALFALARALGETGQTAEATAVYRALLPRASSLPLSERGRAYLEAGVLAMQGGPPGLDEAIAILRQGCREAHDLAQTAAYASLALALDRAGQKAEAHATLVERGLGELRTSLGDGQLRASFGTPVAREVDAMEGLVWEGADATKSAAAWQAYIAGRGGKGPWIDHARQHAAGQGPGGRALRGAGIPRAAHEAAHARPR